MFIDILTPSPWRPDLRLLVSIIGLGVGNFNSALCGIWTVIRDNRPGLRTLQTDELVTGPRGRLIAKQQGIGESHG